MENKISKWTYLAMAIAFIVLVVAALVGGGII
jgi:hypothetical protein